MAAFTTETQMTNTIFLLIFISVALAVSLGYVIVRYYLDKYRVMKRKSENLPVVIARDFNGNSKVLGERMKLDTSKRFPRIKVAPNGDFKHPIVYKFLTPTRELHPYIIFYENDYGKEIMIYYDAELSDFEKHEIYCPLNKNFINIGLKGGYEEIKNRVVPLYKQISDLEDLNKIYAEGARITKKNAGLKILKALDKYDKMFHTLLDVFSNRAVVGLMEVAKEFEQAAEGKNISGGKLRKISSLLEKDPFDPRDVVGAIINKEEERDGNGDQEALKETVAKLMEKHNIINQIGDNTKQTTSETKKRKEVSVDRR